MRILGRILTILFFCLLTILTQIGGIILLCSFLTHKFIDKRTTNGLTQPLLKFSAFIVLYCLATFLLVPFIAKPFGRVPLPLTEENHLKPLNILTCLFNRNYVKPELRQAVYDVAKQMNDKFPETTLNYLDANFPFIRRFPLFPHLSHNDGKKLDFSFCYIDNKTKHSTNRCPSFYGYGICEEPLPSEENTADFCASKGYWQYSLLKKITPQGNKVNYSLDNAKTRELVNLFAAQQNIGKIFIEPHLKVRLNLTTEKIRFHGCQAVRHDDHIHIQLI
jgi:hypothetical protein